MFDKILATLYKEHKATLLDCCDNPEYLHDTLKKIFGKSYKDLMASIAAELDEFAYQEHVSRFLSIMAE